MSSLQIFVDWFKEYYSHEYPKLSQEEKDYWIEEILLNNTQYITKSDVQQFDGCVMCGYCCSNQRCPHVTDKGLCERHDNPINQLCIDYPWTGDEFGIAPLTLNCRYQVSFFIDFLNQFFEETTQDKEYGDFIHRIAQEALSSINTY